VPADAGTEAKLLQGVEGMALEVLSEAELDMANGGRWGVTVTVNPQINVQGAQIAFGGSNAVAQTNNSGWIFGSNTGFLSFG
jgi:hypothetical protein